MSERDQSNIWIGHKQELARHFSVWSLIGLAANCTISWTGLGLGLITAINAGGPGARKASNHRSTTPV
jgi:hypothetical protein